MDLDKVVIIIAKPSDIHAFSVATELWASFRSQALILDSAEYPNTWRVTMAYQGNSDLIWTVRGREWKVKNEQLAGVWWRRPYRHRIAPEIKERKVRRFCEDEARAVFQGWLHALGSRVINPLAAEYAANRKPFQLLKAKEVGLRVPDTVITNDPQDARRFLEGLDRPAIFKVLTGPSWQIAETRRFTDEHFQYFENLRYAPVIFQELIEAQCDIRATVIDQTVFAVSVRPNHPGAQLDWRLDLASEIQPHKLPPETEIALVDLLRSLGLRFGAIDIRLTPQNDYVFLEVNPSGQFLFCEIDAGQPISRTLAASLLKGSGM